MRCTEQEAKEIKEIYDLWTEAYEAKEVRKVAECFGIGLAKFIKLDDGYKELNSVYVRSALTQIMNLCDQNRLHVCFGVDGPTFTP